MSTRNSYRYVLALQQNIIRRNGDGIEVRPIAREDMPSFESRLISFADFLPEPSFQSLRDCIISLQRAERVNLLFHKRGSTIAYRSLHYFAPPIIAFYHSRQFIQFISDVVEERVQVTPIEDQSSCSILIYEREGDRIGWHYDHSFYKGRHFTVLLVLINDNAARRGTSSSELVIQTALGDRVVPAPANTLVIFEGAAVRHRVTSLGANERRIVLSMTFCTDPSSTFIKSVGRRFKDIAYFGIRALWT